MNTLEPVILITFKSHQTVQVLNDTLPGGLPQQPVHEQQYCHIMADTHVQVAIRRRVTVFLLEGDKDSACGPVRRNEGILR